MFTGFIPDTEQSAFLPVTSHQVCLYFVQHRPFVLLHWLCWRVGEYIHAPARIVGFVWWRPLPRPESIRMQRCHRHRPLVLLDALGEGGEHLLLQATFPMLVRASR